MTAPIQEAGIGDKARMCLYSYPTVGKTSFLATGPRGEGGRKLKVLVVRSYADGMPARAIGSGLKEWVANDWTEMLKVQEWARHDGSEFDWVWWDCASIAQDVLLDDIWDATVDAKPARAALTPEGGMDRGEYGRNMERIQQWLRAMVGCNMFHFGVTCHPHEGKHPTNDEGGVLLRPYLQGKMMTEKLVGYMNCVGFMELKENKQTNEQWRRLHLKESVRWFALDRYDAFEKAYVDNPTLPQITERLEAAIVARKQSEAARGRGTTTGGRRGAGRGAGRRSSR